MTRTLGGLLNLGDTYSTSHRAGSRTPKVSTFSVVPKFISVGNVRMPMFKDAIYAPPKKGYCRRLIELRSVHEHYIIQHTKSDLTEYYIDDNTIQGYPDIIPKLIS